MLRNSQADEESLFYAGVILYSAAGLGVSALDARTVKAIETALQNPKAGNFGAGALALALSEISAKTPLRFSDAPVQQIEKILLSKAIEVYGLTFGALALASLAMKQYPGALAAINRLCKKESDDQSYILSGQGDGS